MQESAPSATSTRAIAKSVLAAICGMLGVVLLVAGKSVAGIAMVCSALIVLALVRWRGAGSRRFVWAAVALIAVLWLVAIEGVAGTDIVPDQQVTGYKFVDQVLAIAQRFRENVFGTERQHGPGASPGAPHQSRLEALIPSHAFRLSSSNRTNSLNVQCDHFL
jgi:hypothetical protein